MTGNDLTELAKDRVARTKDGDTRIAREILKQAALAIRDVLVDRQPDPERRVYLDYLQAALDRIAEGYPADKALGIFTSNRPQSVDPNRDWHLFLAVGVEYNNLLKVGDASVGEAIQNVETRHFIGESTIKAAWNDYGGLKRWKSPGVETSAPAEFDEDSFRTLLIKKMNSMPPGPERRKIEKVLRRFPPKKSK